MISRMYRTIYFLNLLQIANFKLHPKKSHNTLLTYKRFSQNSTTIFFSLFQDPLILRKVVLDKWDKLNESK